MPHPISVLVVDDHPALRAGLAGLLEQEPDFEFLGAVPGELEMQAALRERPPDVVVLDWALRRSDGLTTCFRLKQRPDPPAVIIYSAYADPLCAIPAAVAQADEIVSKTAPVDELLDAIRAVAAGHSRVPSPDPEFLEAAAARLVARDLPVLGMLLARVPVREVSETLGMPVAEVRSRALRIIGEMQVTERAETVAV